MSGTKLMDRIRDEMAAADNGYIAMMGEIMTEYLRIHPEAKIDRSKALRGAYIALKDQARKKQKGGCYAMPPKEVFEGMMEYFGLPHAPSDCRACMRAMIGQEVSDAESAPAAKAPADDLFDLDALLGGFPAC